MEKIGEVFIEKAVKRGATEQAGEIFKCIRGYASHGLWRLTPGVATTAYKTAYLIEHYPAEFCGLYSTTSLWIYPVSTICAEAKSHGVEVLGLSINHSDKDDGKRLKHTYSV